MAELIAQGEKPDEHWRRPLTAGETVVLGRGDSAWAVPWERWMSARHAELRWHDGRLRVTRLPEARNPLVHHGEAASAFELKPGDSFVVGRTVFTLAAEEATASSENRPIVQSRAVSAQELQQVPFRDAPHRIEVLRRLTNVISSAADDNELYIQVVNLLLAGIRKADAVALVAVDTAGDEAPRVRVLHWDCRLVGSGEFRPSHTLAREAILRLRDSVVHLWAAGPDAGEQRFTLQGNFDWAFCTPVPGDACKGWGIYVAGRLTGASAANLLEPWDRNDLGEELKFAELVAAILSSLRQVQVLQEKEDILSHFFSPEVLPVLAGADPETALKPKETDVTVLFCDLRGFSKKVETSAGNLPAILERVSNALGVMTQNIFENHGVVADFQGDSAMGFWGWPIGQPDMIERACRAALGIRGMFETFARRPDHPLADFKAGIGIATGRAVAGKIGTERQSKITVFGPVVNLASRLEGMTKILRVPILLDEETARVVRERIPRDVARCRRMALVKPYGLETTLVVSELLPPATPDPLYGDEHIRHYETALDAFLRGDWSAAYEHLHQVPPQDLGKDFLLGFIIQHNHTPPPDWNGVIPLLSKTQ